MKTIKLCIVVVVSRYASTSISTSTNMPRISSDIILNCKRAPIDSLETSMEKLKRLTLPTLIAGWLFGLGIIEYPLGRPWPIASFLYTTFLFGINLWSIIAAMNQMQYVKFMTATDLGVIIYKAIFLGDIALTFYVNFVSWSRRKRIEVCIQHLSEIRIAMMELNCENNYSSIIKHQILTIAMKTFLCIVSTVYLLWQSWAMPFSQIWTLLIAFTYPVFVVFIADLVFITYIRFLGWNVATLNKKLKNMAKYIKDSKINFQDLPENEYWDPCDPKTLYMIRKLHLQITEISKQISDIYGVQILFSIANAFAVFTYNFYSLYLCLSKGLFQNPTIAQQLSGACILLVVFGIKIIEINLACESTAIETLKTGSIINKLYSSKRSKGFRIEIQRFTVQLMQNAMSLTTYGSFTLGRRCLFAFASTITTYLIILIQMDTSVRFK